MQQHKVLVLGGYGFFGQRIAASLVRLPSLQVLIGGRDRQRATTAALAMGLSTDQATRIDAHSATLAQDLSARGIQTVIHTAGPFQNQNYDVATAAAVAGCNYIDLADGRQFVVGIASLDALAKARGVSIVSGASSVPCLSSAVVERYLPQFGRLEEIRIGIASGAKSPGLATVRGVFGYCGKPIRRLESGRWVTTHGWLDLQRHAFPSPVGPRLLGSCDIPDLDLFPYRYPDVRTVTFHAGFASSTGHLAVWMLAQLVRRGMLDNAAGFAAPLQRVSQWIEPLVSDKGGMFVELAGFDVDGQRLRRVWHLIAERNHGPYVPCGAAIALMHRIAAGQQLPVGAMACVGLLTVEEYLGALSGLAIHEIGS